MSSRARLPRAKLRLLVDGPFQPLSVQFDAAGHCIYVQLTRHAIVETVELEDGLNGDYDGDCTLVGFEIIDARAREYRIPNRRPSTNESARRARPTQEFRLEATLA